MIIELGEISLNRASVTCTKCKENFNVPIMDVLQKPTITCPICEEEFSNLFSAAISRGDNLT